MSPVKLLLSLSFLLLTFAKTTETEARTDRVFTIDDKGYLTANFPFLLLKYSIPYPTINRGFAHIVSPGDPLFTAQAIGGDITYRSIFNGSIIATFAEVGEILLTNVPILQVRVDGFQYADTPEGIEEEAAAVYSTSLEQGGKTKNNLKLKGMAHKDFDTMVAQN